MLVALIVAVALPPQDAADIRRLVQALRADRVEERDDAARKLKLAGKAAVAELEKAAKDADTEVAARARTVLRAIDIRAHVPVALLDARPGSDDRLAAGQENEATRLLLDAVDRKDVAAEALEYLAPAAARGASGVAERRRVAGAVFARQLRTGLPELDAYFDDADGGVRGVTLDVLLRMRAPIKIARLAKLFRDADARVNFGTFTLTFAAGEGPADLLPLLEDDKAGTRAAGALVILKAREVLPKLVALLAHARQDVRLRAAGIIEGMRATDVAPQVADLLTHADADVRRGAANLLGNLDASTQAPALKPLLKDGHPHVRAAGAAALGKMRVHEAGPAIRALLSDPDLSVRGIAAHALADLGLREAAKEIAALLESDDEGLRAVAVDALLRMDAEECAPRVIALLKGKSTLVTESVLRFVRDVPVKADVALVVPHLESVDSSVRGLAVDVIAQSGDPSRARDVAPLMKDEIAEVRHRAVAAIAALGAKEFVEGVSHRLEDEDYAVRTTAATALCLLGSTAGVERILESASLNEPQHLLALNALRQPAAWSAVRKKSIRMNLEGSRKVLFDALAREGGQRTEYSAAAASDEGRIMSLDEPPSGRPPLRSLDAAMDVVCSFQMSVIVEADRVRVVTSEEALAFWKEWWATTRMK
jgi:HEAT repeat protein